MFDFGKIIVYMYIRTHFGKHFRRKLKIKNRTTMLFIAITGMVNAFPVKFVHPLKNITATRYQEKTFQNYFSLYKLFFFLNEMK